ncbi:MAG: hypothetical protein WDM92_01200 [Caulobacteraceae bacterium]
MKTKVLAAGVAATAILAGASLAAAMGWRAPSRPRRRQPPSRRPSRRWGPHGFPISQTPRPPQPIPSNCDRACLEALADQVAAAMVAHDPSGLPLSKDVQYTEGGSILKIGDGFWATASGMGTYAHYFADPDDGQIVVMRTMKEGHGPNADNLMAMRVRVQLNRITEIEVSFYKKGGGPAWNDAGVDNLNAMKTPPAAWLQTVPADKRLTARS